MSLLGKIQAAVGKVQGNQELNEVRFRHRQDFTLDGHRWPGTRFSVTDPDKVGGRALAAAVAAAERLDVEYRDLRLLRVHPEDTLPAVGAQTPWDGGQLEVLEYGQASDFTGQSLGTCVVRR